MSKFRKDQVPYLEFFLINLLWGASSFLSSEMVRLATHHLNNETKFVMTFYIFFASSILLLLFIKISIIFTLSTLIWWNFVLHAIMLIFLFSPPAKTGGCHCFFAFLGYGCALNLVCSLNVASYTPSGLRGLIVGSALIYFTSYLCADSLIYPNVDGTVSSASKSFLVARLVLALLSIKFYKSRLETLFSWEYDNVTNNLSAESIGSWIVDGESEDPKSDLVLKAYMPSCASFSEFCSINFDNGSDFCLLFVFIGSVISTSFFSPTNTSATLVWSRYNLERVHRIEIIAGLIGAFAGLPNFKCCSSPYFVMLAYLTHLVFRTIVFIGLNTYLFNIYTSKLLMSCSTFMSSFIGSWMFVVCLLQYTTNKLQLTCKNYGTELKCCCEYNTKRCLCVCNIKEECCGNNVECKSPKECIVWTTWSNHNSFFNWNLSDCLFCTSQNCPKVKCKKESDTSGTGATNDCNGNHYLLRNCLTTCCPYCDLTILLECVRIDRPLRDCKEGYICSCHDSEKEEKKEDEEEKKKEEEPKRELTTVPLKLGDLDLKLSTYAPRSELKGLLCCCPGNDKDKCKEESSSGSSGSTPQSKCSHRSSHSTCCCLGLTDKEGKKKRCGKHFQFVTCQVSSCCHYDLKVKISYKEMNTQFRIGQKPFPNKFDRVGHLMFNGPCCTDTVRCTCAKYHCGITKVPYKSCSSELTGALECKECCKCKSCKGEKKCSHIKVIPSGLPYHYKAKDIKRYGVITALVSSVIFLLLFKVIIASIFSAINTKEDITLIAPLKQIKTVNGIQLTTFNQPYKTDVEYARSLFPSFKGSEDDLINKATEEEQENVATIAKLTKLILGGLEAASFDRWIRNTMQTPVPINGKNLSSLQYANHVSAFLYFSLSEYIQRSARSILEYFERCSGKWEIEFQDFERRVVTQLNINTRYSTDLLKLGIHYVNPKLQKKLNTKQKEIWEKIYTDTKKLSEDLTTLTTLERKVNSSAEENILPDKIALWEFRATLLKKWTNDRTIFLNWVSFLEVMDNVTTWRKYYIDIYLEKYRRKPKTKKKVKAVPLNVPEKALSRDVL